MYRYTTDTDAVDVAARSFTSCGRALAELTAVLAAELHTAGDAVGDPACSAALHELAREWGDEFAGLGEEHGVVGVLTGDAAHTYDDTERRVRATMWDPT